jgi:HAT1-interacting factor 1
LTPEQKKEKDAVIADKKSMLDDLKTRLTDLRLDPTKQDYDSLDPSVVQGLFGSLLGADAATQKTKLAEATKSANDLSGVVRKKAKAPAPAPAAAPAESASSKRKLEGEGEGDASGKRAKTEEAS